MLAYVQDGDYDVVSRRKVLPPGECTRSVCSAHMQQRPPVADPFYICTCYFKDVIAAAADDNDDDGVDAIMMLFVIL